MAQISENSVVDLAEVNGTYLEVELQILCSLSKTRVSSLIDQLVHLVPAKTK